MSVFESASDRIDAPAIPGEVAAVAIERGADPDVIAELTRLFEAVRYGGREPTAEGERRAEELLCRAGGEPVNARATRRRPLRSHGHSPSVGRTWAGATGDG